MKSTNELPLIGLLALLALCGGLLTGQLGWAFFLAALTWILRQYGEFEKYRRWAERPLSLPKNSSEVWYELANVPYRQLGRERQRVRSMLGRVREIVGVTELIPDAVILLDEAGGIETMNSAARSLFNLKKGDIGLGLANIVRSPDFAAFLRQEDSSPTFEFSSPLNPDQQLEARRFDSDSKRKLILVRDITSSNRLLTMRQQFVANVSHELRTPLTVVNGYLETINDKSVDDDLRLQLIEKFTAPMNRMQALVEDLLLLTQLEASTDIAEPVEVSMTAVIRGAVEELQSLQSYPEQITMRLDADVKVLGLEKELHSVCVNLLSNAIRHSGSSANIEISWARVDDKVRLAVTDSGTGIPSEYIDRLTERFFRVDMAGAQARGGTGLGLAIVKHVLKRHDSQLCIESALNQGSRFYCDFRLASEDQPVAVDSIG
jgi:two-component system phosphate regulon sensor histidine kinase PhoR